MNPVGYEFVRQHLDLPAVPLARPALVKPVTRIEPREGALAVPRHVAPQTDDPLVHLLFGLKHEGTELQILAQALPRLDPAGLLDHLRRSPSGGYIRVLCSLWERFTGRALEDLPAVGGPTMPVFDPARYVTGPERRDARWRVAFNGLGSLRYCASVERSPWLDKAMASDVLGRTQAFIGALGGGMMDRALGWAYLQETEDSFAIERETPSEDKARAFIGLLQQAHEGRELSEDYLVELQNAALRNPYDRALQFRDRQNWLRGPARGAAGVTYVPPPPALVPELMGELMAFANAAPSRLDPVVAAAVSAFGFVFIHPFMDGNGRLSCFLFHQALCRSGRLPRGMILPVSVAMKRHEDEYLAVLQRTSRPLRAFWSVRWIDEGRYDLEFRGDDTLYRYWDATACVEFGHRMAEQALEVDLRQETEFLARYDAISKAVGERYDVRGNDLATLILSCLDQGGVLSRRRRKQFQGKVPDGVFGLIEAAAVKALGNPPDAGDAVS